MKSLNHKNKTAIHFFPKVICLTLPEQRERQLQVVKEFEKVGIRNYEFFPGFSPDSDAVKKAYSDNRVKKYPNCFRCGERDCGNPDCNNILLPEQVAVAIGFQVILENIANSEVSFAAIFEDDIVFSPYAKKVLESNRFTQLIETSGLLGEEPVLIRFTHPDIDENFYSEDIPKEILLNNKVVMSNPFFLVNRSFARLTSKRLNMINHTADVIIHHEMTTKARCMTLNIQLVIDRSWSLGEVPSLIHPKKHHLSYLNKHYGNTHTKTLHEDRRIKNHIKKAVSRQYGFIGSPRCGSHFVSTFLCKNGLDIGHECLGEKGIVAWQFAVSSGKYPYIIDPQIKSDFFIHIDEWFVYARNPLTAIPSLIIENQKAPLSYAFRREKINQLLGINLDDFTSPIEKAARSYAHWYELVLKRSYKAVLHIERFLDDCQKNIQTHKFIHVEVSPKERGAGKPYLGVQHAPAPLPIEWKKKLSPASLDVLEEISSLLGYNI